MRLHVLAGARDLLCPDRLPLAELAALLGPRLRPATAFWLDPEPADHDFLLEDAGDRRVEVFARSLAENFGARFEPLVVLPELLGEAGTPAAAVLAELWRHRPAEAMTLHALALPAGIDGGDGWAGAGALLAPRLEADLAALRAGLGGADPAVGVAVTEVAPEHPGFAALLRNAVAAQVAARAGGRLAEAGLAAREGRLRTALAGLLADWHRAGLEPARPVGARELDRIAARLTEALLLRGVAADG
jgi:hypothetical protein